MRTYIIYIYRQDEENPEALAGIAEEAGSGEKRAFNCFDGLRQILSLRRKGDKSADPGACRVKPSRV